MQSSENIVPMIGNRISRGPGGRDCPCCSASPKDRRKARRYAKRGNNSKIWP